jgi:hypothetical protein
MPHDTSSRMGGRWSLSPRNRSAKPLLWSSMTDRVIYRPRARHPRGPLHVDQEGTYIQSSSSPFPNPPNVVNRSAPGSDLSSISRPSPSASILNATARTRTPNSASSSSSPASTASAATTSPLVFCRRRGDMRARPRARWWRRRAACGGRGKLDREQRGGKHQRKSRGRVSP